MALTLKQTIAYLWQQISGTFVHKEEGKSLSTNDYTTAEKDKLASLENAVAITSERITEIIGITPVMTLEINETGDAIINAGWPDENGNIQF